MTGRFEAGPLRGSLCVAGDKSISHRSLMLGAVASGTTIVHGLNRGNDVLATRDALVQMGARITDRGDRVEIEGTALRDPRATVDARNSGTTVRLLIGLCAGSGLNVMFDGDESLRRRPMERVAAPLRHMGACIQTTDGRLPVRVMGIVEPQGGSYILEVPSAQIKSAILLAHLGASGRVRVMGDRGSRDHTERMLRGFGRTIEFDGRTIELWPGSLRALEMTVPGDLSAAAFFLCAAAVTPDSEVRIEGVGVNPTRSGVLDALRAMGADIALSGQRESGGEPLADLTVRYRPLRATTIEGELVVRTIDEIPALAIAAAFASGTTRIRDARELRVKESDRLSLVASFLRSAGVGVVERDDGLDVVGGNAAPPAGPVVTHGDHRIAMAAAIFAAAAGPVSVDDPECVAVSYPAFSGDWRRLQRASALR